MRQRKKPEAQQLVPTSCHVAARHKHRLPRRGSVLGIESGSAREHWRI